MEKIFLWMIDKRYKVSFHDLTSKMDFLEDYKVYTSTDRKESIPLNKLSKSELWNIIINCPSTNGLYHVPGFSLDDDKYWSDDIKQDLTLLLSSESFIDQYINDVPMNTTTANAKYFFKGKNINPKLFVRKHLLKQRIPSRFNDVDPSHETLDDIMFRELEVLSVKAIKEILRTNGIPQTGNKSELIEKVIRVVKRGI